MERLHQAIQKARADREGLVHEQPMTRDVPLPPQPVRAAWDALPEIKLRKRTLQKGRVLTLDGGVESAPYDLLRTRILQQIKQNDWRRVAIVSPHSGCGKTTATANLAFSLSRQVDIRSLVLDFDLRRRGLSELLRQKLKHGMPDVLEGDVDFADHGLRFADNLAFGLNRYATRSASEILQSPSTRTVLDQMQKVYQPDLMLFDMPPLNASDDNFGFLQNVDAAVLIAAAEKTTMSQIDVAERQIAELTNVLGIVLNQCRYTSGAYGHEYDKY